jgi:hypothetical protein
MGMDIGDKMIGMKVNPFFYQSVALHLCARIKLPVLVPLESNPSFVLCPSPISSFALSCIWCSFAS